MSNPDDFLPSFDDYAEFRSALEDAEEAEEISVEKARQASRYGVLPLGETALGEMLDDNDEDNSE